MDSELLLPYVIHPPPCVCGCKTGKGLFVRNIKTIDKKTEEWQRFVILPNVNGQKYTIGELYKSREEQGEFIFLSLDVKPANKTFCEINIENGKYFLTPIFMDVGVYINGDKVLGKTQLKFGDVLILGHKKFRFHERVLDPEAFIYSFAHKMMKQKKLAQRGRRLKNQQDPELFTGDFTPGRDEFILSHILSFVSVRDLKNCRLVSKLWNLEGFKHLKKGSTLSLDLERYATLHDCGGPQTTWLFQYDVEMSQNPMPNVRITLPTLKINASDPDRTQLLRDMTTFLLDKESNFAKSFPAVVRIEFLGGHPFFPSDFTLRLKLLQILSGGHLEQLTWADFRWQSWKGAKDQKIHLPKLKVFTLISAMDIYFKNEETSCPFPLLVQSIHQVKELRLQGCTCSSLIFLKLMEKSQNDFVNLSEISFHMVNGNVVKTLLKLRNPLKKLELNKFLQVDEDELGEDCLAFEQLLAKFAVSLESLQFFIPTYSLQNEEEDLDVEDSDENDQDFVSIRFPPFPKLKSLNIGWETDPETQSVKLIFPDGNECVNYERDLPSLKSLTLWPSGFGKYSRDVEYILSSRATTTGITEPSNVWKDYATFYAMFFPQPKVETNGSGGGEGVQICKTLQFLDVPLGLVVEKRRASAKGVAILKMFPNVCNGPENPESGK